MRHRWMIYLVVLSLMCIVGVVVETEHRQSIYGSLDLLETDESFPFRYQTNYDPTHSGRGLALNSQGLALNSRYLPPYVRGAPAVSRRILDALTYCDGRDIVSRRGTTPLMAGAWEGNAALVGECLRRKHDLEVIDDTGRTALHHAVTSGRRQVVHMLVQAGADVVRESRGAGTPLTLAVGMDRPDLLEELASGYRGSSGVPLLRARFTRQWIFQAENAIRENSGPDLIAQNRVEMKSRCETLRQAAALFPELIDPRLIRLWTARWWSSERHQVNATLTALGLPDPRDPPGISWDPLSLWR